jgi:hypothetical protein
MPTIRKRGAKWQVQIRRKGQCPVSQSFIAKKDAEMWAREMERRADLRELTADIKLLDQYTLEILCAAEIGSPQRRQLADTPGCYAAQLGDKPNERLARSKPLKRLNGSPSARVAAR